MRICYLNPTILIRRPIAELIDKLSDKNEIALFVPKKPFSKVSYHWHRNHALEKAKIYSYSAINPPFIKSEWPIPITPMFFINLFRVFSKYHTIHMWTYFYISSLFTLVYKLFFKRTRVIMSCDTFPAYSFNPGLLMKFLFKIYTKIFAWLLFSLPDKIHIYGKSMIKYSKDVGIKENKLVVIPTGIDLKKFEKAKSIEKVKFGIKDDDFIVLYAGLIIPRKGIDTMLKVIKKLNNPKIKLLLVGEGSNKNKYKHMAKNLKIENQVRFVGWRKDIPRIMKTADILFLPSRGEGLPGIIMEAMASGLPIVASDIPCIPDLIENEKTGFLCKQNDIKGFTIRIERLTSIYLRNKFAKEGFRKIKTLRWGNIINKYYQLYKD